MIYSLYAISNKPEYKLHIGNFKSLKKASAAVAEVDSKNYPVFCILEKQRKNSCPFGAISGYTKDGLALRGTSFITGQNPIQDSDGYFKDFF